MTLELIVEGEGNLRGLAAPIIDFPGDFEVFPPEVTETIARGGSRIRGSKTYTYVLISEVAGRKDHPSCGNELLRTPRVACTPHRPRNRCGSR